MRMAAANEYQQIIAALKNSLSATMTSFEVSHQGTTSHSSLHSAVFMLS